MSTLDQRLSIVKDYDRLKDFEMDIIDDCHVRFMKLFPFCNEAEPPSVTDYRRAEMRDVHNFISFLLSATADNTGQKINIQMLSHFFWP